MEAEGMNFAVHPQAGSLASRPSKIKVLVVDDEPAFCQAARVIIDSSPSFHCVGEAHSATQALAQAQSLVPDVILMDVVMSGGSGVECTKALATLMPKLSVVVMTGIHRPQGVAEALMAGAKGYLLKPFTRSECYEALMHAYSGGLHLYPPAYRLFATAFQTFEIPPSSGVQLTPREEQIMGGFFQNLTDKEIAKILGVGTATVHSHAFNIFRKLKASCRKEAIQKYTENALGNSLRTMPIMPTPPSHGPNGLREGKGI